MDKWIPVIIAVIGTGGFGTILALFIVSPEKRFGSVETRISKLENEVTVLRVSNRFLTMGVSVLTMHSDVLRAELMRLDPNSRIETAAEVLKRVKTNIEDMDTAGE